jgi:propionyl-CoA carboxylase beta chain
LPGVQEVRVRLGPLPTTPPPSGFADAIIQPRETRKKPIQALAMLETKRDKNPPKKHGDIPL